MQLGASFSHPHLKSLNLDPLKALAEFKTLKLTWIRLGCYWSEIEKEKGKYDFGEIDKLVKFCNKEKINIVLTVGMKAPRYPEYYIPDWLLNKIKVENEVLTKKDKDLLNHTLSYLERTVNHFKKFPSIKAWQVENEPLDPSGPNRWKINLDFLEAETNLVRKLDTKRNIVINLWGNELSKRSLYNDAIRIADFVGLDLYLREPGQDFKRTRTYIGPDDTKAKIISITEKFKSQGKQVWITELQTEPWEPGEIVTKKKNPPSFLPKHFDKNLSYVIDLKPEVTLLWGFEYWYWRKMNGDLRYWTKVKKAIKKYQNK